MKYITLILLFFTNYSYSQIKELKYEGGKIRENNLYNSRKIIIDKGGNKYIASIFSNTISINNITLTTQTKAIYLAKYDVLNNFQWIKKLAEGNINLMTIKFDPSSNIFLAIDYKDSLYYNNQIYYNNKFDFILSKIDTSSNNIFTIHDNTTISKYFGENAIDFDEDNSIYLGGKIGNDTATSSQIWYSTYNSIPISGKRMDLLINKYDSLGNLIWIKTGGGNSNDEIVNMKIKNKSIFIIGLASEFNFKIDSITKNFPSYETNCFLAYFDSTSQAKWIKGFGNITTLGSLSLFDIVISNKNIYFTGAGINATSPYKNKFEFEIGNVVLGSGYSDIDYFIASYDILGNYRWAKPSVSYGNEFIKQLASDSNGNILAVGTFSDAMILDSDTLLGYDDAFVTSIDSNGNYLWNASVSGWGAEVGSGIASTTNGEIYIVGATGSSTCYFGNDTVQVDSLPNMFLAKIVNATPVGLQSTSKEYYLKVYPNPNNGIFEIELPSTDFTSLEITDMLGKIVYHQYKNLQQKEKINLSNLSNGLYIIQIKNKTKTYIQKINIVN